MLDLGFLSDFIAPVIVGICLCVGALVKGYIKDVDNKYIPTICAVLGVILAAWSAGWQINPQVILTGLISGWASTGLHQTFKQYIEGKKTESEDK